jgi:hypothetical protein
MPYVIGSYSLIKISSSQTLYCHVSEVAWRVIVDSGLDGWIYWHFFTITINDFLRLAPFLTGLRGFLFHCDEWRTKNQSLLTESLNSLTKLNETESKSESESESASESELLYEWQFTANQFVFSTSPLRPTTSNFIFQMNICRSRVSSVGIETGYGLDDQGEREFESR